MRRSACGRSTCCTSWAVCTAIRWRWTACWSCSTANGAASGWCSTATSTGSMPTRRSSRRCSAGCWRTRPCGATSRPNWRTRTRTPTPAMAALTRTGWATAWSSVPTASWRACGLRQTQASARRWRRCQCGSVPMSGRCGWASCTATPPRWRAGASRRSTCARRTTAPRSRAGWTARAWTPSPAPTPACRCSRRCRDRKAGTRVGSSTTALPACPTSEAMPQDC